MKFSPAQVALLTQKGILSENETFGLPAWCFKGNIPLQYVEHNWEVRGVPCIGHDGWAQLAIDGRIGKDKKEFVIVRMANAIVAHAAAFALGKDGVQYVGTRNIPHPPNKRLACPPRPLWGGVGGLAASRRTTRR